MRNQPVKGMKALWVDNDTHKNLRIMAIEQDLTIQELANAVLKYFVDNPVPLENLKKNGGE